MTRPARRACIAGAALALAMPWRLVGAQSVLLRPAEDPVRREAWLLEGEAALRRGEAVAALEAFSRAAMMRHAADAELGMLRAMVSEGGYRRALAFAAHVAGAHRDTPAASALYAWLLAIGGQGTVAQQVIREARARSGEHALLDATDRALAAPMPAVPAPMLDAPHRAAPHPVTLDEAPAPDTLRGLASGALVDGGRAALVPITEGESPTWLRNGLGQTVRVAVEARDAALGVALLRLRRPIDLGGEAGPAARDPHAGSPGCVVAMAPGAAAAAWPWLHDGFLGGAEGGRAPARRLLFDLPGPCGGAVFDAGGALVGIARAEAVTRAWLPLSALQQAFGLAPPEDSAPKPVAPRRIGLDEQYERALRRVVQALA